MEATERGSPRSLSEAVTGLQEYFTFRTLTSVTSPLPQAIAPRVTVAPKENTDNILPSPTGKKEKEEVGRLAERQRVTESLQPFGPPLGVRIIFVVSAAQALQAAQVQRQRCAESVTPSGRGRAAAAPLDAVDLRKDHVVLLSSGTSLGHQVSATAPWYVARPRLGGYSKGWRRCERRPVSPAQCQNSAALGSRQLSPCLLVSPYSGQRRLKPCASVLFFRNNAEVY